VADGIGVKWPGDFGGPGKQSRLTYFQRNRDPRQLKKGIGEYDEIEVKKRE
jgi:hypothetical protein